MTEVTTVTTKCSKCSKEPVAGVRSDTVKGQETWGRKCRQSARWDRRRLAHQPAIGAPAKTASKRTSMFRAEKKVLVRAAAKVTRAPQDGARTQALDLVGRLLACVAVVDIETVEAFCALRSDSAVGELAAVLARLPASDGGARG